MVRIALTLVCVLAAACAARPEIQPRPPVPPSGPGPAPLFEQGCYACLEHAYGEAVSRGARQEAFEAAALLALRSKELGLPAGPWLDRARDYAPDAESSEVYLDIVVSLPHAPLSGNRDLVQDLQGRMRARTRLLEWREGLQAGPASPLFRAYLDVSLVCAFGRLRENEQSFSEPLDPVARTPLYQYRIGICDSTYAPRLQALRAGDPSFVDADFALARYAIDDPVAPDPERGLALLASAATAFPSSPAITTTIGDVHRRWEEWEPALAAYDAALAVAHDHPEAMLGRTISLSRLMRTREAIEAATRMIELGQWRVGEAYYWRAWNHLLLDDYAAARQDADRARPLMASSALFVLSGTIEWRLRRLGTAEQEFQQAVAMDLGECEAALNLGIVRDELSRPAEALAAFEQARRCYDLSIGLRRTAIDTIHEGPGTTTAKARAAAVHERVLADLEERRDDAIRAIEVLVKVKPS